MNIDAYLFNQINGLAGKSVCLDGTAIFFAKYFEYFLILVLLLFLVKNLKKYWPMVAQAFSAAILSRFVIITIIRWLLPRPRPFVENHVNLLFLYNAQESSFPSGHAAFYFAIATVVFLYLKKVYPVRNQVSNGVYPRPKFWRGIGLGFFLASFLISLARVFSGIHWPSDILAGAVIGIFSGWLIIKIAKKFQK